MRSTEFENIILKTFLKHSKRQKKRINFLATSYANSREIMEENKDTMS